MRQLFSMVLGVMACMIGITLLSQQSPVTGGFSPAPIWPNNGAIPTELGSKYVFYDPSAEQLVIAMPQSWKPGAPLIESSGLRSVQRFDLNTGVRPTISASVKSIQGKYQYAYNIENSSLAKQAVTRWDLVIPSTTPEDLIESPANWRGSPMKSQVSAIRAALGNASSGVLLGWFISDLRATIPGGAALNDFRITSANKPGFTTAFVRGGMNVNLPADLPTEVLQQAAPVLALEFNSRPLITIGPKFAPGTSRVPIAADFRLGISRLIQNRALNANSLAIKEALLVLTNYLEHANAVPNVPLIFKEQPANPHEAEILNALKLSLN